MRLDHVWIVVTSYPNNIDSEYDEDSMFFDNQKEAEIAYEKELKVFKHDVKGGSIEDGTLIMLRHNNSCMKGFRVVDDQLEEL